MVFPTTTKKLRLLQPTGDRLGSAFRSIGFWFAADENWTSSSCRFHFCPVKQINTRRAETFSTETSGDLLPNFGQQSQNNSKLKSKSNKNGDRRLHWCCVLIVWKIVAVTERRSKSTPSPQPSTSSTEEHATRVAGVGSQHPGVYALKGGYTPATLTRDARLGQSATCQSANRYIMQFHCFRVATRMDFSDGLLMSTLVSFPRIYLVVTNQLAECWSR